MMKRTLVTGPVKKPVSLKEAKEHLQVDVGWTDDDSNERLRNYSRISIAN